MKQFFMFAVVCAAVAAGVLNETEIDAKLKAVIEKCNSKVTLPKLEAALVQEAKAHLFCILRGINIVDEHGNADVNEINKLTNNKLPKGKLDAAVEKCKSSESSPIDKALVVYRCLSQEGLPI